MSFHKDPGWIRVYREHCGLPPLLPCYRVVTGHGETELPEASGSRESGLGDFLDSKVEISGGKKIISNKRDLYTNRVTSFHVPPSNSPADIEYLRNRLGYCLPTEVQVLQTQSQFRAPRLPFFYHIAKNKQLSHSLPTLAKEGELSKLFWNSPCYRDGRSDPNRYFLQQPVTNGVTTGHTQPAKAKHTKKSHWHVQTRRKDSAASHSSNPLEKSNSVSTTRSSNVSLKQYESTKLRQQNYDKIRERARQSQKKFVPPPQKDFS